MPAAPALDLREGFRSRFEVVPAISDDLVEEVYRVRHRVYCEELGFEAVRPDELERDEYDNQAVHLLLRQAGTGEPVGCARLVRTSPLDPHSPLPFERYCAPSLDRAIVDPSMLPRGTIAEVSRLAVMSPYRRRRGESAQPAPVSEGDFGTAENPRFPYILVSLYLGIVAMAGIHGIETLFLLTEPRLAAHFAKLGVKVRQIGTPIEHRGLRIPSMMSVSGIVSGLDPYVRPLYLEVMEAVARSLRSRDAEPPTMH
ncbi:MAG: PEP-CTERM/exosortase system-associated acyltransferase [Burkholderiales bacterium]|nr:PEP-CTERM/exosortase system-associated acyltransferase [Burkholderiales bacterium]